MMFARPGRVFSPDDVRARYLGNGGTNRVSKGRMLMHALYGKTRHMRITSGIKSRLERNIPTSIFY